MSTDTPNPYASPAVPSMEPAEEPADLEIVQLRAFVGRNADYYLPKWAPLMDKSGGNGGFNWGAFFLSGLWVGYRKMYKVAAIACGLILLGSICEEVLFRAILQEPTPPELDSIITLGIAGFFGALGNRLYLAHARAKLQEAQSQGYEGDALMHELSLRGGTSLLSSLGVFCMFFAISFATMFALEIVFESLGV